MTEPLTVARLVALLADAVSYADALKRDASRGGAEIEGDELADARTAIAQHEGHSRTQWRVMVRDQRGYYVWSIFGTLYDVIEANDRNTKTLGWPVYIVAIHREDSNA